MSRTYKDSQRKGGGRERRISVRAVRRNPPDLRKLSRAVIALAMEQVAAEAAASEGDKKPKAVDTESPEEPS